MAEAMTEELIQRARKLLDGLKLDLPPDDPELTALALKLDEQP